MRITEMTSEHLQDYIEARIADAQNGALFQATAGHPVSSDKKSIIIGVGGTGIQTVNRIKRTLELKYINWQQQIAFLAIDTDGEQLRKQKALTADEQVAVEFPTGVNPAIKFCGGLQNVPEFIRSWINPQFYVSPGTWNSPGAGQIRQMSRIKIYDDSNAAKHMDRQIIDKIHDAHDAIYNAGVDDSDYNVFIILGVSGGTGSGSMLDIAHFAKTAIPGCNVTGFFMMPDVGDAVTSSMKINGYAALKELDYYYSSSQRSIDEKDSFGYSDMNVTPKQYDRNYKLYDEAFIVSGSNSSVTTNCFKRATETVSEAILNLLADSNATGMDQNGKSVFLWGSFKSNRDKERGNVLSNLFQTNQTENSGAYADDVFDYCAVGVGTAALPEQTIKCNAVKQVAEKIISLQNTAVNADFQGFDTIPLTKEQGRSAILALKLISPVKLEEELIRQAEQLSEWDPDVKPLEKKDIIAAGAEAKATQCLVEADREKAKRELDKAITTILKKGYKDFEDKAEAFLIQHGPKAFVNVFKGIQQQGEPYDGLMNEINEYDRARSTNLQKIRVDEKREVLDDCTQNLKGLLGGLRGGLGAVNTWHTAFKEYSAASLAESEAVSVFDQGQYRNLYLQPIRDFAAACEDFATILDALVTSYDNLGEDFETYQKFLDSAQKENYTNINIVAQQSDYNWVRGIVNNCVDQANIQQCKIDLIESFMKQRKNWTNTELDDAELKPRALFDTILSNQVSDLDRNLSFQQVVTQRLMNGGEAKLDDAVTALVSQVFAQAKPLYRANTGYSKYAQGREVQYLLVPNALLGGTDGQKLNNAFTKACRAIDNGFQVIGAKGLDNKIVCYRFAVAMPMYGLQDIDEWQRNYAARAVNAYAHINESGVGDYDPQNGLAWSDYPEVTRQADPRNEWLNGDISKEGKFLKEQFDGIFTDAEEYGIIEQVKDMNGQYSYVYYDLSNTRWNYSVDLLRYPKNADGEYSMGQELFEYLAVKNGASLLQIQKPIKLEGQGKFSDPNPNALIALDYAKRALRKNVQMYIKIKKSVKVAQENFAVITEANEIIRKERVSQLVPKSLACGILRVNQTNLWQLFDYPDQGVPTDIVRMMGAFLQNEKCYKEGLTFEVLTSRFCNVAKTLGIEGLTTYVDDLYNETLSADQTGTVQKEALQKLGLFCEEAKNFLALCNGPRRTVEMNGLKQKLGIDEEGLAKIVSHYEYYVSFYNDLVDVVNAFTGETNVKL